MTYSASSGIGHTSDDTAEAFDATFDGIATQTPPDLVVVTGDALLRFEAAAPNIAGFDVGHTRVLTRLGFEQLPVFVAPAFKNNFGLTTHTFSPPNASRVEVQRTDQTATIEPRLRVPFPTTQNLPTGNLSRAFGTTQNHRYLQCCGRCRASVSLSM